MADYGFNYRLRPVALAVLLEKNVLLAISELRADCEDGNIDPESVKMAAAAAIWKTIREISK